jgi:signal transduction histidine kinase/DNA-binding response OmpR family regulator
VNPLRILLLEDSPLDAELILANLSDGGINCVPTVAQGGEEFTDAIRDPRFDLILADYSLPGFDGITALEMARECCPAVPFVFVSGALGEENAIETLKLGATDYVLKQRLERLVPSVRRALREASERADRQKAEDSLRFLAEASEVLTASLDDLLTLDALARLAVARVADWCAVDLVDAGGRLVRVALAHPDRSREEAGWELARRFPARSEDTLGPAEVFRTARTLLVPVVDDAVLRRAARGEEHLARLRDFRICSAVLAPLLARGQPLGVLTLATAESERRYGPADQSLAEDLAHRAAQAVENSRLYREAQKARRDAEAANRAKDQFLAVLSHELRTPLTPVLAAVSGMIDDPDVDPGLRPTLEVVERNVELEARLIDDLLDVTRISQGKLRLSREAVDVHALITQAIEICSAEVERAGLRLEAVMAATDSYVSGDPARLQQVYWNLIKNSVKFTPAGGVLTIRSRNESDHHGPIRLVVEVSDTGIGIAPETLPRIFDAFEQGSSGITRRFGGLGLGLAISRSLVELHDGRLSAASGGVGKGATFTVELDTVPAPPPPRAAAPSNGSSTTATAPLRVLYVEDNPDTAEVMAKLLRKRGHAVTTASGVAAALEAARKQDFDILVSDLGLPDGSGLDLMRQLKAVRPMPGIALSGFGRDDDLRRCTEAGFVGHLTKPVDFTTLEQMIREAVRGERPPSVHA